VSRLDAAVANEHNAVAALIDRLNRVAVPTPPTLPTHHDSKMDASTPHQQSQLQLQPQSHVRHDDNDYGRRQRDMLARQHLRETHANERAELLQSMSWSHEQYMREAIAADEQLLAWTNRGMLPPEHAIKQLKQRLSRLVGIDDTKRGVRVHTTAPRPDPGTSSDLTTSSTLSDVLYGTVLYRCIYRSARVTRISDVITINAC
jgi:hypothetical protein